MRFDDPKFVTIHHRNIWGEWTFVFEGATLCSLKFNAPRIVPSMVQACVYYSAEKPPALPLKTSRAYRNAVNQLNLYLTGKIREFTLPTKIYGTDFQIQVLSALRDIPYGKTATYRELAEKTGHPHAERAVGNVLHQNPLQVVYPCHRVIASSGKIGGYSLGLDIKRRLLTLEGAIEKEFALE